jgi:protoporphyrinogen oxidase
VQRIKGLSAWKALRHGVMKVLGFNAGRKGAETSLIEEFLYPKLGSGQVWEEVARQVVDGGGKIYMSFQVRKIDWADGKIKEIIAENPETREEVVLVGDYFMSSMPVRELIRVMGPEVPEEVRSAAEGLVYRDFITMGILLDRLCVRPEKGDESTTTAGLVRDNWIYIQDPSVRLGRLQFYNNWSPWMVADRNKAWLGLEYFCNMGDELWNLDDEKLVELGFLEIQKIRLTDVSVRLLDSRVVRMEKAYPAYTGSYDRFDEIRCFLDGIENLFPVGRNGMHRYNNQDHSMLTAMRVVDNIVTGRNEKSSIWDVNTELEYLEDRATHKNPGTS